MQLEDLQSHRLAARLHREAARLHPGRDQHRERLQHVADGLGGVSLERVVDLLDQHLSQQQ